MIISIDIGTSYSSICMSGPDGKARPVDIRTGAGMYGSDYSLPSAVFVEDDGKVLVGQAAMNSMKRKPQNFRMEFKRDIGQDIPIFLGNNKFLPEDFYTEIFRHMIECVGKISSESIEKVYLTCPAAFGKNKKDKIIAAAKAAGLFQVELVDEPTAAAMNYCAEGFLKDDQKLMVYDFGGGTFDVSLIYYKDGMFQRLTEPHGLERCGGIDMDRLIFQDMLSCIDARLLDRLDGIYRMRFESQLAELAVKAKHHLSAAERFEEDIQFGFDMIPYELTVEKFNGMIAGLVGQTVTVCREILRSANLQASELASVLMVGGTSRVPLVKEMMMQFAGNVPVLYSDDLELAVVKGALNFRAYRSKDDVDVNDKDVEQRKGSVVETVDEEYEDLEKFFDEEDGDVQADSGHQVHTVFFVDDIERSTSKVVIEGKVFGRQSISVGQEFAVYDDEGKMLFCDTVDSVLKEGLHCHEADGEVTIWINNIMDYSYDNVECMISTPVAEDAFEAAVIEAQKDAGSNFRVVSFEYGDDTPVTWDNCFVMLVTNVDLAKGKVEGVSLQKKVSEISKKTDDLSMSVFKENHHEFFDWEEITESEFRGTFTCKASNVKVGDVISNCKIDDNHTLSCRQIASWRYKLSFKPVVRNVSLNALVSGEWSENMRVLPLSPEDEFEFCTWKDGIRIKRYLGKGESIGFPSQYNGQPVVDIDGSAPGIFFCKVDAKKVEIPGSCQCISGFADYRFLEQVILHQGLKRIGMRAFFGCKNLTSIQFPKGLTTIEMQAFAWCENLTSIQFLEGLTTIESGAFRGTKLTSINFQEGLISIGDSAFQCCRLLSLIKLPEGLRSIGHNAFESCNLKQVYIPASCEYIGYNAFDGNKHLSEVIFPPNAQIRHLGDGCFRRTKVCRIKLPANCYSGNIESSITIERY